ncbi:MAG: hypothetical protein JO121_13085 [Deltaproteobacteria bacterium]|nr:hypothetical protein [Deltaproteobacteria bacterium]
MLRLPISPAINDSVTVSRCCGDENDAASKGAAAIHAIGHQGWKLMPIAIIPPEATAAIKRWRVVASEGIING